MIQSPGRVVAREAGQVRVDAERAAGCPRCAAGGGCGRGLLGALAGTGPMRIRAHDPVGVAPGERVVLGVDERTLLAAASLVYGVPLLTCLAAAVLARLILPVGDGGLLGAALTGLVTGFIWVGRIADRADPGRFRPLVLRRAAADRTPPPPPTPAEHHR